VGKTPFVNARGLNMIDLAMGKYDLISAALGYSQPLVDLVHACLSLVCAVLCCDVCCAML
jgi:hypothetical protein